MNSSLPKRIQSGTISMPSRGHSREVARAVGHDADVTADGRGLGRGDGRLGVGHGVTLVRQFGRAGRRCPRRLPRATQM